MSKKVSSPPPDADAVLAAIASNLTRVKSHAALSHYDSRRIWVASLNESLDLSVEVLKQLESRVAKLLASDSKVTSAALNSKSLIQFRKILPAMLRNQVSLASRYVKGTRPEPVYKFEDKADPSKGFDEFSELATLSRQYVDSTIQDAYQGDVGFEGV
jgi:hypothetical protein